MCSPAGCGPAPPVTPPLSPSLASSRSPSPPALPSVRRRRLWSPPMRRRSPTTSRSRLSAASTAPRPAHRPRPQSSDAADVPGIRPLSRSRRLGHRSHHDSRPPSKTSCPSDDEVAPGRGRRRSPSPSPSSTPSPSPPLTPPAGRRLQSVLQRPPKTQHGNRGSRSVASTILTSARKRAQARPPTPTDIRRINRKLRALAL